MSRGWVVLQICLGVNPIDNTCTFTLENFSSFMICWTGAVRQREVSWKETANSLMLKRKCHGLFLANVINFCIDALFAFFVLSLLFIFVFGVWLFLLRLGVIFFTSLVPCTTFLWYVRFSPPISCTTLLWCVRFSPGSWVGLYSCHSFERAIP